MLLGDFPTTVTPSKLYAHLKFNINKTLCERIFGRGRTTGTIL